MSIQTLDIDALEGRELDEAVARIIFDETCRMTTGPFGVSFDADGFHVPPHYSTDIAAAWRLIEHMGEAHGMWGRVHTPFTPGGDYSVGFTPHGVTGWNGKPDHLAVADTLGKAACRAALKAVTEASQ